MEVSGVRSSCETLAIKSRRVFSTRSVSVRSRSTATTPPSGNGAAVTSNARPGTIDVARAVFTSLFVMAALTVARKSGSRIVSTTGALSRVCCGTRRSMGWFAQRTNPSGLTAITASCMLLSSVSSCRWLERTAAKLTSTCSAVLSIAAATRPISSRGVAFTRARRSPLSMRAATSTMRCSRRAIQIEAPAAISRAIRDAMAEPQNSFRRTCVCTASISERG